MEYEVKVCKREDGEYPKLFDGLRGMPIRRSSPLWRGIVYRVL